MLNKPLRISEVPQIVLIGEGAINKVMWTLKNLNLSKNGVILAGPTVEKMFMPQIIHDFKKNNIDINIFQVKSSLLSDAIELVNELSQEKVSFIIAIGGGKTIDVAKYVAKELEISPELIVIPTSTPHDGIATPFIFLNDPTEKFIGMGNSITALLTDTALICQTDPRYMLASIGDLLAKITAVWDWKLAYRLKNVQFSEFSYTAALKNSEIIFNKVNETTFLTNGKDRGEIIKALLITGFLTSFQKELRTGFGSEHLFALKLDELAPGKALHGERVSFGTIISAALQGQDWLRIRNTLQKIGVPVNASEIGIRSSVIAKALMKVHTVMPNFYTIFGDEGITEEAAWNLLYQTGIVGDLF